MHTRQEKMEAFGRILDVLDELREKCPWDRKQTNESLRPQTIEETYELSDAILKGALLVGLAHRYRSNSISLAFISVSAFELVSNS